MAYRYTKESDAYNIGGESIYVNASYVANRFIKGSGLINLGCYSNPSVATNELCQVNNIYKIEHSIPINVYNYWPSNHAVFDLHDESDTGEPYTKKTSSNNDNTIYRHSLIERHQFYIPLGGSDYVCSSTDSCIYHYPCWDNYITLVFDTAGNADNVEFTNGTYISVWLSPDMYYNNSDHQGTLLTYIGPITAYSTAWDHKLTIDNTSIEYYENGSYYYADILENDALYQYGLIICITSSDDWTQIAQTY